MDWLFPWWGKCEWSCKLIEPELLHGVSLPQATCCEQGACAWSASAMVLTSNPPITGIKPVVRVNDCVSSLLVGLGREKKPATSLRDSYSQNHKVGEQRQHYPGYPSPKDPPTHWCSFVMYFSSRSSPDDVSDPASEHWGRRRVICCECPKWLWGFWWLWLWSVPLLCYRVISELEEC